MTLTGKKTLKNKLQQNADQVQHFGIRKLSIGVTSVLLSTLFYVGATNTNTVQASTVDSGVQTAKVVQKKADSSVQAGLNKDKTDDVSGKPIEVQPNQDANANKAEIGQGQAEETKLNDGDQANIKVTNNQLDDQKEDSTITFSTNNYHPNDQYQIYIPKGGIAIAEGDVSSLSPAFGTTTFDANSDNNYYIITDKFISAGNISQNINLKRSNDVPGLNNAGSYEKILNHAYITKNGQQIGNFDLKVITGAFDFSENTDSSLENVVNKENNVNLITKISPDATKVATGKDNLTQLKVVYNNLPEYYTPKSVEFTTTENGKAKILANIDITSAMIAGKTLTLDLPVDDASPFRSILSDGQTVTLALSGMYSVPASAFDEHNVYNTKLSSPAITMVDQNNYSVTNSAGTVNQSVYSSRDNLNWGAIVKVNKNYTADYVNNNQETPQAGTVNVNENNKNNGGGLHASFNPISNVPVNNVVISLQTPDGVDLHSIQMTSNNRGIQDLDSSYGIQITYTDGSTQLIKTIPTDGKIVGDSTKAIRSVSVKYDNYTHEDDLSFDMNHGINFELAKDYANGNPVQSGDLLTLKTTISGDGHQPAEFDSTYDRLATYKENDQVGIYMAGFGHNENQTPGALNAETLTYEACESAYGKPYFDHPVMYIQVPDNAIWDQTKPLQIERDGTFKWSQSNPKSLIPKNVTSLDVNGHTFIKIDLSNYTNMKDGFSVIASFNNGIDFLTSTKYSPFMVVADNLDQNVNRVNHPTASNLESEDKDTFTALIQQEHINVQKASYSGSLCPGGYHSEWKINTAAGTTNATMTQGNTYNAPSLAATQDINGNDPTHFKVYGSIINANHDAKIDNATQVINLPSTADGKSGFTPVLTGAVTLTDPNTRTDLANAATITYYTDRADLDKGADSLAGKTGLTANQVTDWSKIKAIKVVFNKQPLEKQTTARVTMSMVDNNIYDHVGKTIYASSVIYSTNDQGDTPLQKVVINPGAPASAKLTVIGKSKVKTIVHYIDDNGADHYVELPDKLVTYNDGTDTMKRNDFLSKDSDLTSNDHLLLPEHMVLNYAHTTIKNSAATYLNNYPNDIAEFGQPVKYDFDGDAVVFEGKVAKKVTQSHQVKETVHYVKTDRSKISDDVVKKSKEFKDVGYQNPFTEEIKWSATGETDTLPAISSPEITGYTPKTTSIPEQVVNVGTPDIDKEVIYSPDPQSVVYRFVDDDNHDQQVGSDITKNGVTDQTLNYGSGTFTVPTGYELVGELPTSYKFKASGNNPIDIHLKHTTTKVSDPENWPTDLIGTKVDLSHTATRTIEYWDKDGNTKIPASSLPTGVSQDDQQTVTFGRTAVVDNITHKIVSYVDPSDSTKTITDGDNAWQVTSTDKDWATKDNPTVDHYNGPFEEDGTTSYPKVSEQTSTANDQTVKVYYTHKTDTITSKTDKYKDPVGHDLTDADFSKTITRTINIIDDKGQKVKSIPQQVTFTRTATVDEVTGQVTTYSDWQAKDRNNTWNSYTPTIGNNQDIPAGYHISSIQSGNQDYLAVTKDSKGKLSGVKEVAPVVVGTDVDPTTVSDVTVNIHYAPNDQKITYQIIDDTNGTGNKAVTDLPNGAGVTNGDIPAAAKSNYQGIQQELQHSGYEIVSTDKIGNKFGSSTTNLTIHVKHGTAKVSEPSGWPTTTKDQDKVTLNKTVRRTINYFDATNNRPMPSALAPTQEQTTTLTRTAIVDKVTGKVINYVDPTDSTKTVANGDDAWSTGSWITVTNPDLTNKGYNGPFSDKKGTISTASVAGDNKVSTSTNTDSVNIYYTHKTITVTKPTDSSEALPDNLSKDYPTINDADLTKTVTRTIYIQDKTTPVATQPVTFNRDATIDEVTGEVEYSDWTTANNAWGSYIPTLGDNKDIPTGYHISSIKSGDQSYSTVTKDDHGNLTGVGEVDTVVKKRKDGKFDPTRATDIDVTINYEADKQKIHIVYQDSDDHDKEIKRTDLTGVTDGTSHWNADIPSNYELVKGQVDHGDYKFKGENNSDIIVKLSHKHQAGNDQRNVTREIIVNVPDKDSETITRSVNAKRTSDQDLVTGKTTYGQWQVDQLPEYTAPVVPGYTPTQRKVEKLTVVDKNGKLIKPAKVVINYVPDKQKLTVDFIDDANNGKILKTFTKDGKSDERANYSTADDLKSFKKQHYDVASDSTNGKQLVFDHDDQTDQHYEVHLIHHLTPIKDHREVNETVHYQYADGSAAHNDYKATPLEFNRTGERDEVTGTDSWNAWIPGSLSFSKIDSPKIQGYTPNEKAIDVTPVDANSKDVVRTVTYAPDAQTVHYQFVDDDNKDQNGNPTQVGSDVVKNGKTDQTITYHDGDFIIPAGYELVSVVPTSYKFKASGNNPIDIHLKHKVIVITPNDPKQSTDKLPDNPNKNYPTGVSQNDLNETIKRQITVVRPGGSTIDASQLITLTRTATVDEVTGKVIKYSDWTTGSLAEYDAPKISGYTPSRNAPAVEVVKHGDHFEPIKITYISLGSDTDDTKTGDYPGNTSTTSQSNSKEVEHVPEEKGTKLREIKEHKSIELIDKIHITKQADKDYQSNIATLAQDMEHEKHQSSVAIGPNAENAKSNSKIMADKKAQANNASIKQTLPQTGQKNNELGLIGLSAAALGMLTALLGTMIDRKRK